MGLGQGASNKRLTRDPGSTVVCQDLSELRGRTMQAADGSELAHNTVVGKARNHVMMRYAHEARSVALSIESDEQ